MLQRTDRIIVLRGSFDRGISYKKTLEMRILETYTNGGGREQESG
jgi:hypothetical protein